MLERQLADMRAFNIMQAFGYKGNVGEVFPSLREIDLREDSDDDIDPRIAFQQMKAMFPSRAPGGGITRKKMG